MEYPQQNTNFSKLRIIKNLIVISVSFLLLFTAFSGLGMLQTTMNKEKGTAAQAVLYLSNGISSLLFSCYLVRKLGTKNAQLVGMILYLPYIASNFYPSWITLVPSAAMIGIGCALLWGAQCTYFNECSVLYRGLTDKSPNYVTNLVIPNTKGTKELLGKDFMEKTEGLNFEENCENSLELSPPIYLPSYKRSESGSKAESNRQCSEKTFEEITEYDPGFEDLNSEIITDHKSFDAIQSIKETERDIIELQGIKNIQNNYNQKSKSLSSVNSLFFSLHGFVFCSAQVWSNLISFYVLASGRVNNYDKISNCSCGADFCNTDQVCVDTKIEEVPANIRQYYTGVCFACGILSVLLIWLLK
ncbi:uncharacterized protein LOC129980716 [Argiope bruennichi]|uniref:uncharacterized protein LOC129980716 n=1 Tax=Argiope bruennichi TaxID=94029 RepID=UPI0024945C4F|nr:uncharacterized protein LOC129980716 [Argiope bruennichi]